MPAGAENTCHTLASPREGTLEDSSHADSPSICGQKHPFFFMMLSVVLAISLAPSRGSHGSSQSHGKQFLQAAKWHVKEHPMQPIWRKWISWAYFVPPPPPRLLRKHGLVYARVSLRLPLMSTALSKYRDPSDRCFPDFQHAQG